MSVAIALSVFTFAQQSASSTPNSLPKAIGVILGDVRHNFHTINGELIVSQAGGDDYTCLVAVPGALSSWITRYSSEEDTTASWQAKMYESEDFNAAAARYKELYRQLKGCSVRTVDGSAFFMNGEWSAPREANKFTVSTLRVITGDEHYKNVKMELEMLYQFPLWVINIHIGSKKKDTLEE